MDSEYQPIKTPLLLSIALAADAYALYRIYERGDVSLSLQNTEFGPYTMESNPAIFLAVVAFHIIIGIVIIVYLWMGWEPPETDPH